MPFGVRHGVADGLHRKNREFAHGAIAPIFFSPHAARMLTRALQEIAVINPNSRVMREPRRLGARAGRISNFFRRRMAKL